MLDIQKQKVFITDVTGRDGFQMEKDWIPTEQKIAIINGIIRTGVKRVELTSFVSPKAVPQLKDAKEVVGGIEKGDTQIAVLVPNKKGAEMAVETEIDEINAVISVSETHNKKNVRKTLDQSIQEISSINRIAKEHGKKLNVGLATTFGCPFEGLYPVQKVEELIRRLTELEINSFALSDTTGMANPQQVFYFVEYLKSAFPEETFSLHLHNTRGMGLSNMLAGVQAGIEAFDAALGGIGGCPFAPGATGNVCLEDSVHMFEQMGIITGIDLELLIGEAKNLESVLGYTLPGQVMKSGQSTKTYQARKESVSKCH
ncbi:hydroxymethylglutaryl-CoA lyase [Evansella sp. LMS18]|uniref:hydroxymethylglutaryl-CoA lyase n=1 Tax=Evansella sp. LMS18 TaxID=2924033 RepID=UPI0020D11131|nr:hydroxymethylglutaryl-CoA lyase [Evansella sp. LMS18]UTR12729.1 hydroxymethylglutaryl-CoA lyase [Evansella sp. LMS18]